MASTLPFDTFWSWLVAHPHCVLRAGTPDAALYDEDDLHWQFGAEEDGALVVQVWRGKRVTGEIFLDPEPVTYVEWGPGEQDGEFLFDLISESETDRTIVYHFVLAHGYEEHPAPAHGGRIH